jgi:lysophospholipase L1-like esterase
MGVEIRLNSLGQRSPEPPSPRPNHEKWVLVLGSSVTMGWGVPFDKVFTSVAERTLNSKLRGVSADTVRFFNAGIGNYNTESQSHLLDQQMPLLRPDAVVLNYFISDAEARPKHRNSFIFRQMYIAAYLYERLGGLSFQLFSNRDLEQYYRDLYRDDSAEWLHTQELVRDMHSTLSAHKIPFFVIVTPDIHNLSPSSSYPAIYKSIERQFKSSGIDTVNAYDALQKTFAGRESDLWIQSDDPHPNEHGHKVFASVLDEVTMRALRRHAL